VVLKVNGNCKNEDGKRCEECNSMEFDYEFIKIKIERIKLSMTI
jgi:hypothetical protein